MKIVFGGDVMPGGVLYRQEAFVDESVSRYLQKADACVYTLECAVGEEPIGEVSSPNVVYARECDLWRLKSLNTTHVSLANNHVFDMGVDGFQRLVAHLNEMGIKYFGAGVNKKEASRPAVIDAEGKSIALFGCSIEGLPPIRYTAAEENNPGVFRASIEEICNLIKLGRQKYDGVYVLPHWGKEYQTLPLAECVSYSKRMIDAGANGVFGSHTHKVQPNIRYKGCPICFSMGSLLFPDVIVKPQRCLTYPPLDVSIDEFSTCVNYPKKVNRVTLAKWSESSRYSKLVEIETKTDRCKTVFTDLRFDNVVTFLSRKKKWRLKAKLLIGAGVIRLPNYLRFRMVYY